MFGSLYLHLAHLVNSKLTLHWEYNKCCTTFSGGFLPMESQCTKIDLLFTSSSPVKEKKGLQIISDQIKLYFYLLYFFNCIYLFFISSIFLLYLFFIYFFILFFVFIFFNAPYHAPRNAPRFLH